MLELVFDDGRRLPLSAEVTIGRAPENTLQLSDPSVSRHHAQISPGALPDDPPLLHDVGSRYGTWLDGRRVGGTQPLRDGAVLRLGDQRFVVERRRSEQEAGRTVVVPPGASLAMSALDGDIGTGATSVGVYPRLRSGYALKRLEASEGPRRWVLRDTVRERYLRLSDADASLLTLLDGKHSVVELVREAELRLDGAGPGQMAQLVAELAERGLLAGTEESEVESAPPRRLDRLLRTREWTWPGAGAWFERLYKRGGWLLLSPPTLVAIALLSIAGIAVFAYLVLADYGTPFVVARKVGLGGLVFILGRFALVAAHETAHGLTMASFGRRAQRAGLKLLLVFPYAYVDTSEAWFEPRRRRIAVSAAGPISDLAFGGLFAVVCLALSPGSLRDIVFQLAFAAYIGALFNLNPLLERDGYQILSDVLREPGLRRRAMMQLRRRLSGGAQTSDSPVLARYGIFALAWSAVAAVFAVGMSVRYESRLSIVLPGQVVWGLLFALWLGILTPVLALVVPSLRARRRTRAG